MPKRRLTKKQERQIASNQRKLMRHDSGESPELTTARPGMVISHYGRQLTVEAADGELYQCKLRQNLGNITCGDHVLFQIDESSQHGNEGIVVAISERKNLLEKTGFGGKAKPVAANIDKVFIICAIEPEPNPYLIDRYIVATENLGATPVIVLNKADLINEGNRAIESEIRSIYEPIGYQVIVTSAKTETGFEELATALSDATSIFVGLSGVGKSSLAKVLLPDTEIKIGKTSQATGEGKHTTTVSSLYHLGNGGKLIDSPGVRDFTPTHTSVTDINNGFIELKDYVGRCRFTNCAHNNEPGCAIRTALEDRKVTEQRVNSFRKLLSEAEA